MDTFIENLQNLFHPTRLFAMQPPSAFDEAPFFLLVFGLLLTARVVLLLGLKKWLPEREQSVLRHWIGKISSWYAWSALIGILLILSRTQYVAFFSMRFFLLTLVLIQISLAGYFVYEAKVLYPKYQAMFLWQLEKEKYLPKRKAHK